MLTFLLRCSIRHELRQNLQVDVSQSLDVHAAFAGLVPAKLCKESFGVNRRGILPALRGRDECPLAVLRAPPKGAHRWRPGVGVAKPVFETVVNSRGLPERSRSMKQCYKGQYPK